MVNNTTPVVVVGEQFVAASQMELTVTDKRLILDSPLVTDVNGNLVLKINRCMIITRSVIVDNADRPLVCIQPKNATMHARIAVYRGDSRDNRDLICTVKRMSMFSSKLLGVFLPANTQEEVPDFSIKRKKVEGPCTLYLGNSNRIIAKRGKEGGILHHRNSVTVYPNVDYAFIVALSEVIKIEIDIRNLLVKSGDFSIS